MVGIVKRERGVPFSRGGSMLETVRAFCSRTVMGAGKRHVARQTLSQLLPELRCLRSNLEELDRKIATPGDSAGKILLLIEFFRLTSPWYDRGFYDVIGKFEVAGEVPEALQNLSNHLYNAGRNGRHNRSERGERVNEDNVWLSSGNNLPCTTIRGLFSDPSEMENYNALWSQVRGFMSHHVQPIIDCINNLEKIARGRKPDRRAA